MSGQNSKKKPYGILILVLVLASVFAQRLDLAVKNDRYITTVSEQAIFNRVVDMTEGPTFDPGSLRNPSLGLYARMFITSAISWTSSLDKGGPGTMSLRSATASKPEPPSFVANHPSLLLANRILSLLLSLGVIALTYAMAVEFGLKARYAVLAALLPAVSPSFILPSFQVTDEALSTFLCLACSTAGIRSVSRGNRSPFLACCGFAGLAVATSYSCVGIVFVPLFVFLLRFTALSSLLLGTASVLLTFLVCCPYALKYPGDLLAALGAAVWPSPGSASHAQSRGSPFALSVGWIFAEGIGIAAGGLAAAGIASLGRFFAPSTLTFAAFPVIYLVQCLGSPEGLPNNLLMLIPYFGVLAGLGISRLVDVAGYSTVKTAALPAFGAVMLLQLGILSILVIRGHTQPDSRDMLVAWLENERRPEQRVAISRHLQAFIPPAQGAKVINFDPSELSTARLLQSGFSFVVLPSDQATAGVAPLATAVSSVPGSRLGMGAPRSPAFTIFKLNEDQVDFAFKRAPLTVALSATDAGGISSCRSNDKDFCWISARLTSLKLTGTPSTKSTARLTVMNSWENQRVTIRTVRGTELYSGPIAADNAWHDISLILPAGTDELLLLASQIHPSADAGWDPSSGVALAIKSIRYDAPPAIPAPVEGIGLLKSYPENVRIAVVNSFLLQNEELPDHSVEEPHPSSASGKSVYEVIAVSSAESAESSDSSEREVSEGTDDAAEVRRARDGQIKKRFIENILTAVDSDE